ncbi:TetR/AcrR family transcriptional regulator [Subtercola boreus]|nr:TetR/AcrR family transcriptional regulator [Subtercola boreus]
MFDEDTLLDAAVELFWVHGYRAASLADLSARTGVANGSLYQAFGSKWVLFLAVYHRYCARRVAVVARVFDEKRDGIEQTVNAYFDAIVDDCASHPDRRGCLMLNTISEFGTNTEIAAISTETVDQMEAAVFRGLSGVTAQGFEPAEIAASAAHIVALSQALIQLSRMGRDDKDLRRIGTRAAASIQRQLLAA